MATVTVGRWQALSLGMVAILAAACNSGDPAPAADAGSAADGSTLADAADEADVDSAPGVADAADSDAEAPDAGEPDAGEPDAAPATCGDGGNLVVNCGLETDTTDWVAIFNATISRATSDARTGDGSLQIDMVGLAGQSNWSADDTTCIALTADTTYSYGAWAREIGGAPVNFCHAQLFVYPGVADCSGTASVQQAPHIAVDAVWGTSEGSYTATATGDSARVHIRCQGGAAGSQVLIDDIYLRP